VVSALTKATLNGKLWSSFTRNCSRRGLPKTASLVYKLISELWLKFLSDRKTEKGSSTIKRKKVKELGRREPTRSERINK